MHAMARVATSLCIVVLSAFTSVSHAQSGKGGGDIASRATNSAAALIQLQLQNSVIPSSDKSDGYANTAVIQPVYPIVLGKDHYFQSIITRTTVPIVTTPDVNCVRAPTTRFVTRGGQPVSVSVGGHGGISIGASRRAPSSPFHWG